MSDACPEHEPSDLDLDDVAGGSVAPLVATSLVGPVSFAIDLGLIAAPSSSPAGSSDPAEPGASRRPRGP